MTQQTVNITPDHVMKRVGQIEELQRRLQQLIERHAEAVKKLGLDNWPTGIPSFNYTQKWLAIIRIYYGFLEIEEKIRAGRVFDDEEWMNLRKKADDLSKEIYNLKESVSDSKLLDLIREITSSDFGEGIRYRVYRELPYANVTMKSLVQEREEIKKVLEELTNEMLDIERKRR